jgi:hypothetical protein
MNYVQVEKEIQKTSLLKASRILGDDLALLTRKYDILSPKYDCLTTKAVNNDHEHASNPVIDQMMDQLQDCETQISALKLELKELQNAEVTQ